MRNVVCVGKHPLLLATSRAFQRFFRQVGCLALLSFKGQEEEAANLRQKRLKEVAADDNCSTAGNCRKWRQGYKRRCTLGRNKGRTVGRQALGRKRRII